MFYGSILFRFVGTLTRWVFGGFKKSFRDIWKEENRGNLLIGMATTLTVCFIIIWSGC